MAVGSARRTTGRQLVQVARVTGLDRLLRKKLTPWRLPLAVHDPGKIVLDLAVAVAVAVGGDCGRTSPWCALSRACSAWWRWIRRCHA